MRRTPSGIRGWQQRQMPDVTVEGFTLWHWRSLRVNFEQRKVTSMKKHFLKGFLLTVAAAAALAASSAPSVVAPTASVQAATPPVPVSTTTVITPQTSGVNTSTSTTSANTVTPVGGTLAPGPVGGQITSGATGGQLSPGAVGGTILPASTASGAVPTLPGLLGRSYFNPYSAYNYSLPGSAVIVAGGNGLTATGGTLLSRGVGGNNSSVIVTGGRTLTGVTGGTYLINGATYLNNGIYQYQFNPVTSSSSVIVTGGQTPSVLQTTSGTIIVN